MSRKTNKPSIGILGLWHLGLVYSGVLANMGFEVTGYDLDNKVVAKLKKGKVDLYEPKVEDLIQKNLNRRLNFSTNPKEAIKDKKFIFICLDISLDSHDRANLKKLNKILNLIIKFCSPHSIIVLSSQIPVGTSRLFLNRIQSRLPSVEVIYFPENLRLGSGIDTFIKPERIILGSDSQWALKQFRQTFTFFHCQIISMSLESAEMAKHALNSYLALNISFSSEIGDICELVNADMNDVVKTLKSDSRVSPKAPINPGLGFAGGTLGRDIQYLSKIARNHNYNPKLITAAYKVNNDRLSYLLRRIEAIFPTIANRLIGLLGLSYKPFTNTLRHSLSIELARLLISKRAHIKAFDPSYHGELKTIKNMSITKSIAEFFDGLEMAILMTEWPEFRKIDPKSISPLMKKKIIFDTKNFLNDKLFINNGFSYYGIGHQV